VIYYLKHIWWWMCSFPLPWNEYHNMVVRGKEHHCIVCDITMEEVLDGYKNK